MSNNIVEDIKKALVDSIEKAVATQPFSDINKALRPEVTREQLYALVEALHEAIEAMIELPEEDAENVEDQSETIDVPEEPKPVGDPDKNEINWPVSKSSDQEYESDNEEEDKWDNLTKACWSGYKQEGMKDKNGRMVPNCVPVEKAHDVEDKEEPVKKSLWSGIFTK